MSHRWKHEARSLTTAERSLLDWMIDASSAGDDFVEQAASAQVVGVCDCGCPTIDLSVDGSPLPKFGPSTIIADAAGKCPSGNPVGVIVHVRDGLIAELEVYSQDDSSVTAIPRPDDLSIV